MDHSGSCGNTGGGAEAGSWKPLRAPRTGALTAVWVGVLMALSGCTSASSLQSGVQRNAAANPVPVFSVLGAVSAVVMIVVAILATYALVLAIIYLRLRIAELKRTAPPQNRPPAP